MQTIALICTDDTGKGVVDPPEEPDDRFDDMTLIGELGFPTCWSRCIDLTLRSMLSVPTVRCFELDSAASSACGIETPQMASVSRRRSRAQQETASQV